MPALRIEETDSNPAPFSIPIPTKAPRKEVDEGLDVWVPGTYLGDPYGMLGSSFQHLFVWNLSPAHSP